MLKCKAFSFLNIFAIITVINLKIIREDAAMKNIFTLIITICLLWSTANLTIYAGPQTNADKGIISVSTTANTEIVPDVAEISFAVQTNDSKSMQKATSINKEISDRVIEQLKSIINCNNGDYIKTSDFSANPVYSYNNSKKTFERYEVVNRIVVHTKNTDKIGHLIDEAIAAGATNVDSLTFSVSDYESQCNELLGIATKKAKVRAEAVAASLSTSLSGISNISTSCSVNNYNHPRLYTAKNMIADTASEAGSTSITPISSGLVKIFVSVNASFVVKQ